MFITYVSEWLYNVMQLPVPIVLSPKHIYSITIWNLFIGSLILGILLLLIKEALNNVSVSDFIRSDSNKNEIIDKKPKASITLSRSQENIGVRILKNKERND